MTADLSAAEFVLDAVYRETGDDRVQEALRALQRPAARGTPAWTEAMLQRPARIARIAAAVAPGLSIAAASDRVAAYAERYQRTRWRRDRSSVGLPADLDGTPEAEVWHVLRVLGSFPANSTIRSELSDWHRTVNPANPNP